jgi:hypothetical protein
LQRARMFEAQSQPFEVSDGLLKDVAEDIDIND